MKTFGLALSLAALAAVPAHAEIFQSNMVGGAVVGAVAGAIIGNHNRGHTAEGALIGAAAGLVIGAAIDQNEERCNPPVPVTRIYDRPAYVAQIEEAPMVPPAPCIEERTVYVDRPVYVPTSYVEAPCAEVAVVEREPAYYCPPATVIIRADGRREYRRPEPVVIGRPHYEGPAGVREFHPYEMHPAPAQYRHEEHRPEAPGHVAYHQDTRRPEPAHYEAPRQGGRDVHDNHPSRDGRDEPRH